MKRIILLAATILFTISVLSSCRPPELEGAYVDYNAGRMDNALKLAKEATEKYPENFEAWYLLGDIYGRQDDYKLMLDAFDKSLSLSKDYEGKIKEQKSYYYAQSFNRGINNYNEYIKAENKKDPKAQKVLDQAISDFAKATLIKNIYQPNELVAVCYDLKNDSLNTVKAYDKLVKLAPDSVKAWLHYGNFYLIHSDSKSAIKYIEKAYELDNNNPDVIASLSQAYDFAGEQDKAIVLYNKAIELNPEERAFPFNLGLLYYKRSMQKDITKEQKNDALEKCIENFNIVIDMDPDSDEDYYKQAYEILSSAQIQLEQFKDARTTLITALDLFPDAGNLYYYLGVVYSQLNDKKKAKEAFDKAEKLGN